MMSDLFGLSEKALSLSEDRAVMLTTNIVNSGTPNYKAKDIEFEKVLTNMQAEKGLKLTSSKHIQVDHQINGAQIKYRVPMQYSMDGNTVDPEIERKNFLENSMKYQVSLTFIQNKTEQLMKAIKGD